MEALQSLLPWPYHIFTIANRDVFRKYVEGGQNKVLKFQEGQEVSMCSMLNLGGLGHALQENF